MTLRIRRQRHLLRVVQMNRYVAWLLEREQAALDIAMEARFLLEDDDYNELPEYWQP